MPEDRVLVTGKRAQSAKKGADSRSPALIYDSFVIYR
jgi:hypothetical protein